MERKNNMFQFYIRTVVINHFYSKVQQPLLNVEGLIYGVKIPHFAVWIVKGLDGNHSLTTVVSGKKRKEKKCIKHVHLI